MCSHCTGRVDKALNALDGVTATVSLEDKAAYVTVDGAVTDEELKKAVPDYLLGRQSLDDTISKIQDGVKIYLAE